MASLLAQAERGRLPKAEEPKPEVIEEPDICVIGEDEFNHEDYKLQMKAIRIATELKGPGFSKYRAGMNLCRHIYKLLLDGDYEGLEKLRARFQFNRMPTYQQRFQALASITPSR